MAKCGNDRWGRKSIECIKQEVINSIPRNTIHNRKSVWSQFTAFCRSRHYEFTAETSVEKLAIIMKDWAYNMKKCDGEDYKETVVKQMWNTSAKLLQEKFYNDYKIKFNPFQDIEFKEARDARDVKRRQLKLTGIPEKRKITELEFTNEELNEINNIWDEETPVGLQQKFYHMVTTELGWKLHEAANALLEHFVIEVDNSGKKTGRIEYNPVFTKLPEGGTQTCTSSKWLTPNTSNPTQCPVRLFHKLMKNRPPNVKSNRLFLTPNPFWKAEETSAWYKNMPVGKNKIAQWRKEVAEKIGLDSKIRKITNYSTPRPNLSTEVTRRAEELTKPEQQLTKITSHSKPYLTCMYYLQMSSIEMHLPMDILQLQTIVDRTL